MSSELHKVLFQLAKSLREDARKAARQAGLVESEKLQGFYAGMETALTAVAAVVEERAAGEFVLADKIVPLRRKMS